MSNGWTEERRRKQAEAIKQWQPWKGSTGPKTKAGKERASLNALKTGEYSEVLNRWRKVLQINADFLNQIRIAVHFEEKRKVIENELMDKHLKKLDSAPPKIATCKRTNGFGNNHNPAEANHDP